MNTKNIKSAWAVLTSDCGLTNFTTIKRVFGRDGDLFVEIDSRPLSQEFDKSKKVFNVKDINFFFNAKVVSYSDLVEI